MKRFLMFFSYFISTVALLLFTHAEVLFNGYSYGRHWDWTFLPSVRMYQIYAQSFFSVINNNALGTYGAIGLSDFLIKKFMVILAFLIPQIPVWVLNKYVVFVLFPTISAVGIYFLCAEILGRRYRSNAGWKLWLITFWCNLIYSFSLTYIYDLHGGALNRQVSVMALPFILAVLYRYAISNNKVSYLLLAAVLSLFLDVSNIFYISLCIALLILAQSISIIKKIGTASLYALSLVSVHMYWLYELFFSNAVTAVQLSADRRLAPEVLQNYSVSFRQLLLFLATPHNLIQVAYGDSPFIYAPAIVTWGIVFLLFYYLSKISEARPKMFKISILLVLTTSILALGTYSVANVYLALYQIPYLGFLQNSVRFAPNVILSIILLLLVTISALPYTVKRSVVIPLTIGSIVWVIFLITNPGIIRRTFDQSTKNEDHSKLVLNNEIGSLYEPDLSMEERMKDDSYEGVILPIPSTISPYFTDNLYPTNSQGSQTEIEFSKPVLQTAGNSAVYESVIRTYNQNKKFDQLLADFSIQYIWKTSNMTLVRKENQFDHIGDKQYRQMVSQKLGLLPIADDLLQVPLNLLQPLVTLTTPTKSNTTVEYRKVSDTEYIGTVHNAPERFTLQLNKQYYPGWQLFWIQPEKTTRPKSSIPTMYTIQKKNSYTQATNSELSEMLKSGLVTIESDSQSGLYISKNIKGTIQNESLARPTKYRTMHMSPEQSHLRWKGYANSWEVGKSSICPPSSCKPGDTLSFMIVFGPQRTHEWALIYSSLSLAAIILYYLVHRSKSNE